MSAEQGTAIILVEQHAEIALSMTETALILERGRIVHRAASAALLADRATLDRLIGLRGAGHGWDVARPAASAGTSAALDEGGASTTGT
jgi:hypothetical protein